MTPSKLDKRVSYGSIRTESFVTNLEAEVNHGEEDGPQVDISSEFFTALKNYSGVRTTAESIRSYFVDKDGEGFFQRLKKGVVESLQWNMPALRGKFCLRYEPEPFVLACRICASCMIGSLFTLLFKPEDKWPRSTWVMTTAGIVLWTASIDTATTAKKLSHRIVGTTIGGFLGFSTGFVSWSLFGGGTRGQAATLFVLIAIQTFIVPYIACISGFRGNYAANITMLTFGIVVLSFYDHDTEKAFEAGLYRWVNIIIGCLLSGSTAFWLFPISTSTLLEKKIRKQIKSTGTSAKLVLASAHDTFAGVRKPHGFEKLLSLRRRDPKVDEAYAAYMKNMDDWKGCKALFPLLEWDPIHRAAPLNERIKFQHHMSSRLARVFRVQTILILIDMSNRFGEDVLEDLVTEPIDVLKDVGCHIEQAFDLETDLKEREAAVQELMETDLVDVRQHLERILDTTTDDPDSAVRRIRLSTVNGMIPLMSLVGHEQVVLFLLLVEQLILRSVQLHHYCLSYQEEDDSSEF